MGARGAGWVEVGDPLEDALLDDGLSAGVGYEYRVQAWGGHGASEWAVVEDCIASAAPECSKKGGRATARWQPGGGRSGEEREEAVSYFRRGLMVAVALLVGVLSRNALFLDLFFKICSRVGGKVADTVRKMVEDSKSSPHGVLRCIHPTMQAGARGVGVVQSALGAMTGTPLKASEAAGTAEGPVGPALARAGSGIGGVSSRLPLASNSQSSQEGVLTASSLQGSVSEGGASSARGGDGGDGEGGVGENELLPGANSIRSKHGYAAGQSGFWFQFGGRRCSSGKCVDGEVLVFVREKEREREGEREVG